MKGQTNRFIIANSLQKKLRIRMTDAENRLWRHLRGSQMKGFKFRRQHPFLDYVLDFVCLEKCWLWKWMEANIKTASQIANVIDDCKRPDS